MFSSYFSPYLIIDASLFFSPTYVFKVYQISFSMYSSLLSSVFFLLVGSLYFLISLNVIGPIVVVIGELYVCKFLYFTLYCNIILIDVSYDILPAGNAVCQSCTADIIIRDSYIRNTPNSHLITGSICKYDLFEIFPNLNAVT